MYHFAVRRACEPLSLSVNEEVPGHVAQYLREFQVEALHFCHACLSKDGFCVLNDETGLGKTLVVSVLLDVLAKRKKTLLIVPNDVEVQKSWRFHIDVLTQLKLKPIPHDAADAEIALAGDHEVYLAAWPTLHQCDPVTKFPFDFVVVDNRTTQPMLYNTFCTTMLLQLRVNIVISTIDITSDLKLMYTVLRLGRRLSPEYENYRVFEKNFNLPEPQRASMGAKVDLEEYFQKRKRLSDLCCAYRLRRYRYNYEKELPLVQRDVYLANVESWRRQKQSEQTTVSRKPPQIAPLSELDEDTSCLDTLEEPIVMSPLIFLSETEAEEEVECLTTVAKNADVRCETIVDLPSSEDNNVVIEHLNDEVGEKRQKQRSLRAEAKKNKQEDKRRKKKEKDDVGARRVTRASHVSAAQEEHKNDRSKNSRTAKLIAKLKSKATKTIESKKASRRSNRSLIEHQLKRGTNSTLVTRETRSMQRKMRSANKNNSYLALGVDILNLHKRKSKSDNKSPATVQQKGDEESRIPPDSSQLSMFQESPSSEDYDRIQCAQRLSASDTPPLPTCNNDSVNTMGTLTLTLDSDVILLSPPECEKSTQSETITVMSSQDEDTSATATRSLPPPPRPRSRPPLPKSSSMRTQTLRRKLMPNTQATNTTRQSPDLFSNCSETLTHSNSVKPLQLRNVPRRASLSPTSSVVSNISLLSSTPSHEPSCLDRLEELLTLQLQNVNHATSNNSIDITKNSALGSTRRVRDSGDSISPNTSLSSTTAAVALQNNKITNYWCKSASPTPTTTTTLSPIQATTTKTRKTTSTTTTTAATATTSKTIITPTATTPTTTTSSSVATPKSPSSNLQIGCGRAAKLVAAALRKSCKVKLPTTPPMQTKRSPSTPLTKWLAKSGTCSESGSTIPKMPVTQSKKQSVRSAESKVSRLSRRYALKCRRLSLN